MSAGPRAVRSRLERLRQHRIAAECLKEAVVELLVPDDDEIGGTGAAGLGAHPRGHKWTRSVYHTIMPLSFEMSFPQSTFRSYEIVRNCGSVTKI